MIRRRPISLLAGAAATALLTLSLAGCGSSSKASASPDTTAAPTPTTPTTPTTIAQSTLRVAKSSLGNILVDSNGRTLYLFQKDSGTTSACTGPCATFWPPVTVTGTPTAGSGAKASLIGTTKRSDGSTQVTYNGHPVYLYGGDHKAGDTTGQGIVAFGGGWFVLSPAGTQIS
jgi:predicted lipoprotein with Yx(FWY)xxD motif